MGVINIMLVSVTERTREIGLRKALGATRRNILFQFFLEGLMLTAISGAHWRGRSLRGHQALRTCAAYRWIRIASHLPGELLRSPWAALAVAGIVAGLYPARRAALLTPVEALRQE